MCSKVSSILAVQHVERDFLFEQLYTNGSVCDGFIQICKSTGICTHSLLHVTLAE